jgi:diaminopimelate decarboxylase
MGYDCATGFELELVRRLGLACNGVILTSNNTADEVYRAADETGAIINVDKGVYVQQVKHALGGTLPQTMAIRYNPGWLKSGDGIIGSKFGDTEDHIIAAVRKMDQNGVARVGLHAMLESNEMRPEAFGETARLLRQLGEKVLAKTGVEIAFMDIGGGIGVNYRPGESPANLPAIGQAVQGELGGLGIPVYTEYGRYITAPHGYLLTRVTQGVIETYEPFLQVDTSSNNILRMKTVKGAYHHMTVLGREGEPTRRMNVTGSMCAGSDVFIMDRELPEATRAGDLAAIHGAGAHAGSNASNFNALGRAGAVLLRADGTHKLIKSHEKFEDVFATVLDL